MKRLRQVRRAAPIVFGRYSYADTPRIVRYAGDPDEPVRVGAYTSIAENVEFMLGGNHRTDWVSTYPFRGMFGFPGAWEDGHPASRGPIVIGSDVWIGKDVLVLSGVTIGHGAVVGARSVVTRDVEPYMVVAGAPAKPIRRRFDDATIARLLDIAWWDWPHDEIIERVPLLNGGSVEDFLRYAYSRACGRRLKTVPSAPVEK